MKVQNVTKKKKNNFKLTLIGFEDTFDLMFNFFRYLTNLIVVTSHHVVLETGRHPLRAVLTRRREAGQTLSDRD